MIGDIADYHILDHGIDFAMPEIEKAMHPWIAGFPIYRLKEERVDDMIARDEVDDIDGHQTLPRDDHDGALRENSVRRAGVNQ